MPLYSYQCSVHGEFMQFKSISSRNEATYCPDCNMLAERFLTAPNLSVMSDTNRKAWQRNEKSMHEPKRISRTHVHTHDHSHDHSNTHSQLTFSKNSKRPWMLGH